MARVRIKGDNLRRFLSHVEKTDSCWLWGARINHKTGYGAFRAGHRGSRMLLAHRWSYEHFAGPIPEGLVVDHLCSVRHCVNPAHLEVVTQRENLRRSRERAHHEIKPRTYRSAS